MTFTQWLLEHAEEGSPRGDLARDVAMDARWPRRARSMVTFEMYLLERGACEGALRALCAAWQDWEKAIPLFTEEAKHG